MCRVLVQPQAHQNQRAKGDANGHIGGIDLRGPLYGAALDLWPKPDDWRGQGKENQQCAKAIAHWKRPAIPLQFELAMILGSLEGMLQVHPQSAFHAALNRR